MVSRVATRIRGVLNCGGFSSCVSCCSLLSALLLFVLDGVSHNLSAPIFPTQARQKQLSQTNVGLISALGSLSDILASLLLIFIARPTNQRFLLFLGAALTSLGCSGFGLSVYLPDGTAFLAGSAATRILLGAGCGLIWSTAIPTLSACYPQWESRIPSLVEAVFSIGQLLGPAIATFLYTLGGYYLPFVTSGFLQFTLMLVSMMVLPSQKLSSQLPDEQNIVMKIFTEEENEKVEKIGSVYKFSLSYGVNSISSTVVGCGMTLGFLAVAIAPHLEDNYSISQDKSGYYFLPHLLLALVGMFAFGLVVEKGFSGPLCIFASVLGIFSYALLGLSASLSSGLVSFLLPFTILGLTIPAATLPAYLLLEKASMLSGITDVAKIKLYVSSWINVFLNIGFILGEFLIGGWMFDYLGFHFCCLSLLVLMLFSFVLSTSYISINKFTSKVFYS